MRLPSQIFFALLIVLCMNQLAHAGAWTQAAGNGQLILNHSYYRTSEFVNENGRRQSQPLYQKFEINPYLEYGITDSLTAGANLFLQYAMQESSSSFALPPNTEVTIHGTQHNVGIGDSEFFLRARLWQKDGFVFSAEPMVKLPALTSYTGQPDIGSSHADTGLGFSAGYGFKAYGLNHFANLDTGYRYRFGKEKDQVKAAATLGISLDRQWMVMPQLFITRRASSPSRNIAYSESASNDYNLIKLQLSVVYTMWDETSIQLGAFYHAHARNTGTGGGILIALWEPF